MGARLQDKTTLVTGATSNIGRAIDTAFAAEAHVSSSAAAAGSADTEVADQIREEGGRADFIAADLDGGGCSPAHAQRR
jgi:NAD(P)-dependent dehydrogenase (short-subunit alcohol dehydrogenase family)